MRGKRMNYKMFGRVIIAVVTIIFIGISAFSSEGFIRKNIETYKYISYTVENNENQNTSNENSTSVESKNEITKSDYNSNDAILNRFIEITKKNKITLISIFILGTISYIIKRKNENKELDEKVKTIIKEDDRKEK